MIKTFWQGEPCTYKVIVYEVTPVPEKPLHWQNRIVGTRRQGLEITYAGQSWILDNGDGSGWYKITDGMGSPRCGHKDVSRPANIMYVFPEPPNMFNERVNERERLAYDAWAQETDPGEWKKLKSLEKMLKEHTKKYGL